MVDALLAVGPMAESMLTAVGAIALLMLPMWLLSIPLKNVSIVDIGWGIGFVLIAWSCAMFAFGAFVVVPSPSYFIEVGPFRYNWSDSYGNPYRFLLPALVTIWGLRLAGYLAWRNVGKPEDYRYVAMRQKAGPSFVWSSLLRVFLLQGVVMWVVALPIQAAAARPVRDVCLFLTIGGVVVWSIGVFFEAVGDWQLARFKSNPDNKGRVMDRGLWRYTRHPNYFGDFCVWWGLWLVSLGVSDYTATWWTVISPAVMSFFLIKVSGVALLERAMKKRSDEYEAYIARTSTFFPWPPKSV